MHYPDTADQQQLKSLASELDKAYKALQAENLSLDITRGKPAAEQISIANKLDGILNQEFVSDSGIDTRNYGTPRGLPEMRKLGSELLDCPSENVLAAGNSSLMLMFFTALMHATRGTTSAGDSWKELSAPKFICPVPGYDRHFTICEHFDIEMITAPMTDSGPDMDVIEKMVADDDQIIGLWCVPKYSNPTGVVYSEDTVERIAKLGEIANPGFRVFWDNAYAVHDLTDKPKPLASLWDFAQKHGTEDNIWMFASSSKITFAGAGVSWAASSENNLKLLDTQLGVATIGFDKVNQLRHAKLFPDLNALREQMQSHADLIQPKFAAVLEALNAQLQGYGEWTEAEGGYFISFDTKPGLAKKVVQLAAEAGVKLTPAGATFPYGQDPEDTNIRIAPTFPSVEDVKKAMEVFCVCVKLASVQKLTNA